MTQDDGSGRDGGIPITLVPSVFVDSDRTSTTAASHAGLATAVGAIVAILLALSLGFLAFMYFSSGLNPFDLFVRRPQPPDAQLSVPREKVYVPVGHILASNAPLIAEGGGFAVVLLRRNSPRNYATCEVFLSSLAIRYEAPDQRAELIDGVSVYRRPVYWPSTTPSAGTIAAKCSALLERYDHDRADVMLARFPNLRGGGPFLVVWREDGQRAGTFDFSAVPTDELAPQFEVFVRYMSQQNEVWSPSFYQSASVRQRLRTFFVEEAAPSTAVIARLWPPGVSSASVAEIPR